MESLSYLPQQLRYHAMLGVGGIGGGTFFQLNGNHTLGREESRSGHFLDHRDYCKLHIIAHYVKVLLGEAFPVYPIGKVGQDDLGTRLVQEMQAVGLETSCVTFSEDAPTLTAICILYPDGSGGNLTLDSSACDQVDSAAVDRADDFFARFRGKGIALVAPEIPLSTRRYLLDKATTFGFYRAASFTRGEMDEVRRLDLLSNLDLLALNLEEAATLAEIPHTDRSIRETVHQVIAWCRSHSARLALSITAGRMGSYYWDGSALHFTPAFPADVASAAGAGDAYLATLIAAAALEMPASAAAFLASLVGSISTTSPHTIHPHLDAELIRASLPGLSVPIPDTLRPYL
jgi:ribokinase